MDRLEAMSVLVAAVDDRQPVRRRAASWRMPLATVSRKLSELEAHLGTRLLIRSTRKLTLTDAGRGLCRGRAGASSNRSATPSARRPANTARRAAS